MEEESGTALQGPEPIPRETLLRLGGGLELGLLMGAAFWAWRASLDLREALAFPSTAWRWVALGWSVAVVGNGLLLALGALGLWEQPRRWLQELFLPLFGSLRGGDILLLSATSGFCEEVFFRGVMQALWGWGWASVVFGLLHFPGARFWGLGAWATAMGAWLGWLYQVSGCLWVPILTHGLYNLTAMAYIRRQFLRRPL